MMAPAMTDARYGLRFALLRAALFAAVCTGPAMLGHTGAGAPAPGPGVFAACWAGIALLALPFARGRRSVASLVPGLLGAQLLLHLAFSAAAPPLPSGPAPVSLEHMCGGLAVHGDAGMLLAHAWAALVTGWWLASGEEALWAVLYLLRARFPRRGKPAVLPVPAPSAPVERPRPPYRTHFLRYALAGRAPPRWAPRPCAAPV